MLSPSFPPPRPATTRDGAPRPWERRHNSQATPENNAPCETASLFHFTLVGAEGSAGHTPQLIMIDFLLVPFVRNAHRQAVDSCRRGAGALVRGKLWTEPSPTEYPVR